ncbi:Phospholipid glycerol acyltransferase [Echinococcus multilocularis]|uniref:1-acylglycerol-3-phosphate O-acyltransferase n=1 Tax=Echinococcus multilocularis TaxID=6211 RepID=A0A087W1R3_ECHMU|nr:Phospholipid glycerol acyltransferase [Echinococcus multilocularis]
MDTVWLLLFISILTVFYIICKIPIVRYYVKYFALGLILNVGSVFFTLTFLIKGKPSFANSCDVMPLLHLSQCVLGLQPKLYGLENCYIHRQCIYVINHQSFIDAIVISHLWREPSSSIVKDSLRFYGLGWPMIHFMRILSIVRNDHAKAMKTMHEAVRMVKKEHVNMFIFPEGTRNHSGRLLPFKKGAFHLAIQTQLPIVPVVISCYNCFLDHKYKIFEDAAYAVYILAPISTEGLTSADATSLTEKTHAIMSKVFDLTASANKEDLWMDLREREKLQEHEEGQEQEQQSQ